MYCTLEAAVKDFCAGKFLILVDAQERENEGDLIVAAEHMSGKKTIEYCWRRAGCYTWLRLKVI